MPRNHNSQAVADSFRQLAADLQEHTASLGDTDLLREQSVNVHNRCVGRIIMLNAVYHGIARPRGVTVAVAATPATPACRYMLSDAETGLNVLYYTGLGTAYSSMDYAISASDIVANPLASPAAETYHGQFLALLGNRALSDETDPGQAFRLPADDELATVIGFTRDQSNMTLGHIVRLDPNGHKYSLMLSPIDMPPLAPE